MRNSNDSDDNNGVPESNRMLFWNNTLSKNISYKDKDLTLLSNKVKCTVLEKTIIARFEVIENFYSDLPRINIG